MDKFLTPWPHYILQETFSSSDFIEIQRIMSCWPKPNVGGRLRKDIDELPHSDFILHKLQKQIYPILYEVASVSFSYNVLSNPLIYKSEYNCQSKNHRYKIHRDVNCKLVSIVTHISANGNGTSLYNIDKTLDRTLPWKPNSSFIFANGFKYHSFSSDHDYRVTLTSTLEIENAS
jgi:hypothetical protein